MTEKTKKLGERGEALAAAFLEKKGYKILFRNYKCSYGEIDIIAKHKKIISFIEVKTRSTTKYGPPQDAVIPSKQAKISRVALEFIQRYKMENRSARFDVVAVQFLPDGCEVNLIENAFELSGEQS